MVILAPKLAGAEAAAAGASTSWHVACFTCSRCQEMLAELCYCVKDGSIYCERHYAELVRPRCAACDEVPDRVDCTLIIIIIIIIINGRFIRGSNMARVTTMFAARTLRNSQLVK